HYDIVFVESSGHAYSQIKRVMPDLVILCVRIEDLDGFQVLSMLKLDDETRDADELTQAVAGEARTDGSAIVGAGGGARKRQRKARHGTNSDPRRTPR